LFLRFFGGLGYHLLFTSKAHIAVVHDDR
jgi:hypothetical protein